MVNLQVFTSPQSMTRVSLGFLTLIAIILSCSTAAHGETIVMDGTKEHVIEVSEGEVLIIDTFSPYAKHNSAIRNLIIRPTLFLPTKSYFLYFYPIGRGKPVFLVGKCSLGFATNSFGIVSFRRTPKATNYSMILLEAQERSVPFEVPSGKNLRFHAFSNPHINASMSITKDNSTVALDLGSMFNNELRMEDLVVAGPSRITLGSYVPIPSFETHALAVTYYFEDQAEQIPGFSALAVGPGGGSLIVEKSTDLKSWQPVSIQAIDAQEKTFFRFGISR